MTFCSKGMNRLSCNSYHRCLRKVDRVAIVYLTSYPTVTDYCTSFFTLTAHSVQEASVLFTSQIAGIVA